MLKRIKIGFIIVMVIILLIAVYGYFSYDVSNWQTVLSIIGRYGMMLISLSGGGVITYHFFKVFFEKHKRRKLICYSLTTLALIIGITIYTLVNRPTKVVRMKEDVLYIRPKSEVQPNDIYDGSVNDPNLKQDTTNQ